MGRGRGTKKATQPTGGNNSTNTNTVNTGNPKPNSSTTAAGSSNSNANANATVSGSGKGKAKPPATPNICIRCPDLPTAIQNMHPSHDFNPCFATYTTPPDGTHAVSTLWWGFSDGVIGENMTLADMNISSFDSCSKMLKAAKAVGADAKYKSLADFGVESNLRTAKSTLQWEEKVISKEALEAAMKVGRQQDEFKDQQNVLKALGVGLNGGHKKIEDVDFGRPAAGDAQGGSQGGGVSGSSGGAQDGGDVDSGQASGSGQAGMAGGGGGSGSSANTTQGTTNLASRPKGKGPADPATTSVGTPVTTTSTPPVCPRCPVGCPFKNLHVDLLVCLDDVSPLDKEKKLPEVLWPNITTENSVALLVEGFDPCGLLLGAEKKVDHDVIAVMMQSLQAGEAAYDGVPFTKALAEATLVEYYKKQRPRLRPPEREPRNSHLQPVTIHKEVRSVQPPPAPRTFASGVDHDGRTGFPIDFDSLPDNKKLASHDQYALRESLGDAEPNHSICVNHFEVTLPDDLVLYEYEVSSTSPAWAKATRNKRKVFVRDAIDNMPELKDRANAIASDYYGKIVSGENILGHEQSKDVLVRNFKPGTYDKPEHITVTVKYNCEYRTDSLKDFVFGRDMTYAERGAAQALNMVVSKAVAAGSEKTFMAGNNKFFYRPGWQQLAGDRLGLIAVRGYYCSVRPGMRAVTLNINTLTSVFYRSQTVHQYLVNLRSVGDDYDENRAWAHLGRLRVFVNFDREPAVKDADRDQPERRTKTIYGFAGLAKDRFFFNEDGKRVSVLDHLRSKYPRAPKGSDKSIAVNVGAQAPNEKFYLAEQLDVLSDQIYGKKLDSNQTANMIELARRPPAQNRTAILEEGLQSLRLDKASPTPAIFDALKITVGSDMLSVPARRAKPPTVTYGSNNAVEESRLNLAKWNTARKNFIDTSKKFNTQSKNGTVVFIHIDDDDDDADEWRLKYRTNFLNTSFKNGLQSLTLASPKEPFTKLKNDNATWNEKALAASLKKLDADLLVLMLPRKTAAWASRHAAFKIVTDQVLGVKSAVLCEESMRGSLEKGILLKDVGDNAMAAYFGNYAMKLNLRLGNANHRLDYDRDLPLIGTRNARDLDTIILGADVTHPGGGSTSGTPSVAALVGSMDHNFAVYSGQMRRQVPKQERMYDLDDMAYRLFLEWAERNGNKMPSRTLWYRDGVDEGQYSVVRDKEVSQLRKGWEEARAQLRLNQQAPPQITAVIVAKRHHTRFYPKVEELRNGNCQPGTIVESSITSPYFMDFYLQSHNPLIGTGKPAHYFVIENGIGFTAEQLQNLTNNICYLYGRSTNAVSYATPAYYADRLCERGRHYLREMFDGEKNLGNEDEQRGNQRADACWDRCGENDGNPWHPNLNRTMFWM
ncbi:hypothetical protein LTR10_009605 [Elasticomyces elasticus]|nr:hypothetical protein LTR10_009605 [Elasticomyces elasticus]KAK4971300.1 hypothetical protein LTR42_007026 [Elasticomyces elasticus]